jgi:hypothetical protein
MRNKIVSAKEAVAVVRDGDTFPCSGVALLFGAR